MLSEVTVCILVAVLKICEKKSLEPNTPYLPTSSIIRILRKYMLVEYILNSLIFKNQEQNDDFVNYEEFEELVQILADKSLGGIENSNYGYVYPAHISDNGKNLILLNSTLRSHEERTAFWKIKLQKLFSDSNKQWLLDQFRYCKLFLAKNSYEEGKKI